MDRLQRLPNYLENFVLASTQANFSLFSDSKITIIEPLSIDKKEYPRYVNEFWTSKQRQASSLHEVAYRACFKPQLPNFFINLLTKKKDTVYDPFGGRGTTAIEAGLLGRNVISNDINPLSKMLCKPRFFIPDMCEVKKRLYQIKIQPGAKAKIDLSMFFHSKTEEELISIKGYLESHDDEIDQWIRMVATNRLTGHSPGYFSVYTLPPNQAVSAESQVKINIKRNQKPEYRDVRQVILKKTLSLTKNVAKEEKELLRQMGQQSLFLSNDARDTKEIKKNSVHLIVTSPPFLDVVQYSKDNWLRCWFNSINDEEVSRKITVARKLEDWSKIMGEAFKEFYRIIKPNGWIAFEVGEVRGGKIKLDEYVIPLGLRAGFNCEGVVINKQEFTKTANIWGIDNNNKGTNTNRVVLFHKI